MVDVLDISPLLAGTKRIAGRCNASLMASASSASFLFDFT